MRVAWSLAFLLAWSPQLALAAPTEAEINAARKLFGQAQEHEAEGRWIDEKTRNPNGTRKRLYRLFITCCAADSRAIPIVLEFNGPPPELPENGWAKVAGTMRFPLEEGVLQPVLVCDRADSAEPPYEESFLRR